MGAVEVAFGLVDVRLCDGRAHVFQRQAVGRERRGIDLDAHRRLLAATDTHQAHARELRNFLREPGIGEIFDFGKRQRL